MASTSLFGRAKCKRNVAGKVCKCQEWDPASADESLCDGCEHHMSFHEPCHPIKFGYGRCLKEFDNVGSSYEDGCQEFCPSPSSKKCGGCGCHRSYHKPVPVAVGERAGPSNILGQQQDPLCVDSSIDLVQPSSKKLTLDPAVILTRVDEDKRALRSGGDLNYESGVPDVGGTTIADDDGLQHHSVVEDGNSSDRDHLEAKHKVFLSHSGVQKDFVEQLCIDLERYDRYPFFDKRQRCLPVGIKFPKLLFDAIKQCEVGVVVLSEEFFSKTKWPMLELVHMVREAKKLDPKINIVPVFFRITRDDCRKLENMKRWTLKWEEWAKIDKTIRIDEWKEALKIFGSTTGLCLKDGEVQLRAEVVEAVCELVLPETRWDDSDVEGKDRLCKVILGNAKLELKVSTMRVCMVGLHGVGGIGKTTICKVLCNRLFKEFRGRVCHIEMKSASEVELFRAMLKTVTDTRHDLLDGMNLDQCRDQLRRCIVKHRMFLAIDNVDEETAKQARTYLEARHSFGNRSMMVVTARSLDQLKALNIHEDDCLPMPELEVSEARALFETHARSIGDTVIKLDEKIITHCVGMCRFQKGDGNSHHYLPLALKVLGNEVREQLGCNEDFNSELWDAKLTKIKESQEFLETKKQIFSVLRISYDTLSHQDRMLFMDVALFVQPRTYHSSLGIGYLGSLGIRYDSSFGISYGPNLFEWLGLVHGEENPDTIKTRLEILKKKSLLEKVGDGSTNVSMHDLWREFCVAETNVEEFADRRCVYFEEECHELGERTPSGHWEKLERMCFLTKAGVQKFLGLRLEHFLNLKVLMVVETMNAENPVDVDLGELKHLKLLELENYWNDMLKGQRNPQYVERIKVRGLGSLANLAFLKWIGLPAEAVYAEDIACLTNLQFLKLPYCRGNRLPDLSKLTSLRVAFFHSCVQVETVIGLSSKLSNLRSLTLAECSKLQYCPGLGDLIALETLDLSHCTGLNRLPDLGKLTNLKELYLSWCTGLYRLPDLGKLTNLKELYLSSCWSLRVCPGLFGLRRLRKLDISLCWGLITLPSLSDLVSLEELHAPMCFNLAVLPDMRNLTKLRVLDIEGSPVKAISGFEGLIALQELKASFGSLEDWPDLHRLTSLRIVGIDGWNGRGLASIVKLEMLETLRVKDCKEVDVQLDLRNMKTLQRLTFVFGELKYVRVTNGFELQYLEVNSCGKVEVLDLSGLHRLQSLTLYQCEALKRLTCREPLVALRSVKVVGCMGLKEVSDLSNFPDLPELHLGGCKSLTSVTSEKPLGALKILDLQGCTILMALPDLSYFPHLETLNLTGCERLTSLSSGVRLLALEKLHLGGCTSLKELPDLSNFPCLGWLVLGRCSTELSLTCSEPLPALQVLHLGGCRSLRTLPDLLDLSHFPHLKKLDLSRCESLTRLSSGVRLLALEELDLGGCTSLKALPDLSNFPCLRRLDLRNCSSLLSLTSSEPLPALQDLDLEGCLCFRIELPDIFHSSVELLL